MRGVTRLIGLTNVAKGEHLETGISAATVGCVDRKQDDPRNDKAAVVEGHRISVGSRLKSGRPSSQWQEKFAHEPQEADKNIGVESVLDDDVAGVVSQDGRNPSKQRGRQRFMTFPAKPYEHMSEQICVGTALI